MCRTLLSLSVFLILISCGPSATPDLCSAPELRPNRAAAIAIVENDRAFAEDLDVYQTQYAEQCK